jgi:S-disulfanyl-L-cysteine oxidoreductase SoxD
MCTHSDQPRRATGLSTATRLPGWGVRVRIVAVLIVLTLGATAAFAQAPNLGKPISPADLAAWDISIMPDGSGLPPGSGTSAQGARIYAEKCSSCHGANGKGGLAAALIGGQPLTSGIDTPKTIANFWPYATTLFDFTRRAMPWPQPRTLTNDEVYAVTAYILALNKLIGENDVMNADTLPKVRMPNREGFIVRFPDRMP